MTIPPFGDNISNVTDANTFRVWFDATNSLIQKLNPLEIYGITAGVGEVAGITLDINRATGAAVIGLDLPLHITGPHKFGGGISFENEVRFKGLTVDAHGATFFGNLVRSFNGQTGDITAALTGVGLPGNIANGDMLIYSPNGSTLVAYSLFTGGTFDSNNTFRFGGSGGMLLGTGGVSYGFVNQQKGNVQIFGVTGAQISLHDASFDPTSEPESGAHMFFGRIGRGNNDPMGFVYTGGKTSGFESNSNAPYVVIQHSDRKIGLLGITNPSSPIDYKSRNQTNVKDLDVRFTDSGGITSGVRVYQNGFAKTNEGIFTETLPKDKGLRTKKSIRILGNQQNVAVELDHTSDSAKSNFTVFGQESSGSSLSPVINVRNTGDVVIGGLTASDVGSSFGSLNIVSGRLLVGGTLGVQSDNGVQVLTSSGISTGYKVIFPNTIPFSTDTITASDYKSNFGSNGGLAVLGYRCEGGNTMATNKNVSFDLLPEMCGNFARIASSAGVTYAPIDGRHIAYSTGSNNRSCIRVAGSGKGLIGDSDGDASDFRTGLDRAFTDTNPYDAITTFRDEDGNNLVGDFDIEIQMPPGTISGTIDNASVSLRNLMGVAVFVDFTDDDLLGLTLGVRGYNNLPNNVDQPGPPQNQTFPGNNGQSTNIGDNLQSGGNPRANIAPRTADDSLLHSRILYCFPHGRFGQDDPAGGMMAGILQGGRMMGIDAHNHANDSDGASFTYGMAGMSFTLTGTCLRRLQILPFFSKNPNDLSSRGGTDQGFGAYEFNNNPDYDPYFPGLVNFGRTDANNNIGDDRGYLSFANGNVKGSFKQVEVN